MSLEKGAVRSRLDRSVRSQSHGRAVADPLLAARGRQALAALAEAVATTDGGPAARDGPPKVPDDLSAPAR
jgi:hypothetical protein